MQGRKIILTKPVRHRELARTKSERLYYAANSICEDVILSIELCLEHMFTRRRSGCSDEISYTNDLKLLRHQQRRIQYFWKKNICSAIVRIYNEVKEFTENLNNEVLSVLELVQG